MHHFTVVFLGPGAYFAYFLAALNGDLFKINSSKMHKKSPHHNALGSRNHHFMAIHPKTLHCGDWDPVQMCSPLNPLSQTTQKLQKHAFSFAKRNITCLFVIEIAHIKKYVRLT